MVGILENWLLLLLECLHLEFYQYKYLDLVKNKQLGHRSFY